MSAKRKAVSQVLSTRGAPRNKTLHDLLAAPLREQNGERSQACSSAPSASGTATASGVADPAGAPAEPWTTKFAPASRKELAVNKKKVQSVEDWLRQALTPSGSAIAPCRCCCISGLAGSGRHTTLRILAQEHGCRLAEWDLPMPTLYSEHRYCGIGGPPTSKMDAFADLVARAKLAGLPLTSSRPGGAAAGGGQTSMCGSVGGGGGGGSVCSLTQLSEGSQPAGEAGGAAEPGGPRTVWLLSDLPHVSTATDCDRLVRALEELASSVRQPLVVLVTQSDRDRSTDDQLPVGGSRSLAELVCDTLVNAGAAHLQFRPFTKNMCVRELHRVAHAARCVVSDATAGAIAEAASCDMFAAIQMLEMNTRGRRGVGASRAPGTPSGAKGRGKGRGGKRGKAVKGSGTQEDGGAASAALGARDMGLTVFHALGKILYNKRGPAEGAGGDRSGQGGSQQGTVGPLDSGGRAAPALSPEEVVVRSGMRAGLLLDFLFENYLRHVNDDAEESMEASAAYFSDAACMVATQWRTWGGAQGDWIDPEFGTPSPADAAAAALATRGYMWANSDPAKCGFQPLRGSAATHAWRASRHNHGQAAAVQVRGGATFQPVSDFAVSVLPAARGISAELARMNVAGAAHPVRACLPLTWQRLWKSEVHKEAGGGIEGSIADRAAAGDAVEDYVEDGIEEW